MFPMKADLRLFNAGCVLLDLCRCDRQHSRPLTNTSTNITDHEDCLRRQSAGFGLSSPSRCSWDIEILLSGQVDTDGWERDDRGPWRSVRGRYRSTTDRCPASSDSQRCAAVEASQICGNDLLLIHHPATVYGEQKAGVKTTTELPEWRCTRLRPQRRRSEE